MRKYFLLIIYITGLLFTQQSLKASFPTLAIESRANKVISLSDYRDCKLTCFIESNSCLSDLNLEDDENVKSKTVYNTIGSFLLQSDTGFTTETYKRKYRCSFRAKSSGDLFKLNRAFRL